MDHQIKIFQSQKLFEESNEQNMYFSDFQFFQSLEKLKPSNINHYESIKRMINFIKIILYLKTSNLKPTQIKFSYVGCDKDNNWGLKHVICYRTQFNSNTQNAYDSKQFHFHSDQDNELVWNLGKIWLRFYTQTKIIIHKQTQQQIHSFIQKNVQDEKIKKLMRKMLIIKCKERISFEDFIQYQVFAEQNFSQTLSSSINMHFQMISQNQKVPNSLTNKKSIKSPFQQEILRRDLKQSLEICHLLQKCIYTIRNIFEKSIDIEFHVFIIKAEAYCILKKLDQKKTFNRILDYTVEQKKQYSKFVTKMFTLRHQLQRKMKMKIFTLDSGLNHDQKKFLMNTDEMTLQKIHPAFKNIIIGYYSQSVAQLKEMSMKNQQQDIKIKKICVIEKRCLIFLLTRLSNQIFSELRTYIFNEFIKRLQGQKILNIKDLIEFIENGNDPYPLKIIRSNVYNTGLQKATSVQKLQPN